MKKILLFGAIAISTLTFGQNVPSYVPTNGLVGWWPFNGNANDESGNGNNGTVNGATLTADRNGNNNSAYSFDGVNDNIYLSPFFDNNNSIQQEITYSYWINLTDLPTSSNVYATFHFDSYWKNKNASVSSTGNYGHGATNPNISYGISLDTINLTIDNWYHIVYVFKPGSMELYLNGELINEKSVPFTYLDYEQEITGNSNGKNLIGSQSSVSNGDYRFYNGKIDDFGLWNKALSHSEIIDLYNSMQCQTPTATITPQGNTTFCQGNSVVLEATSGSNYTYQWYKNGNVINGETNQTYTTTTSGNYTVKVIDGACDATSSTTTVTVNSNPTVSFTLSSMISNDNGNVTLNGSPSGGTYTGNGITGNTLDPSSVDLGKQTIVYDYTDNNGCSGSKTATTVIYDTTGTVCTSYVSVAVTDTLIIDVSLAGLSAPNNINTMKVYPNPSNDLVNIDNGDYALMNGYSIKIINALGQEKFSNAINIPAFQIPVSQLGATGVYYINIYDKQSQLFE